MSTFWIIYLCSVVVVGIMGGVIAALVYDDETYIMGPKDYETAEFAQFKLTLFGLWFISTIFGWLSIIGWLLFGAAMGIREIIRTWRVATGRK